MRIRRKYFVRASLPFLYVSMPWLFCHRIHDAHRVTSSVAKSRRFMLFFLVWKQNGDAKIVNLLLKLSLFLHDHKKNKRNSSLFAKKKDFSFHQTLFFLSNRSKCCVCTNWFLFLSQSEFSHFILPINTWHTQSHVANGVIKKIHVFLLMKPLFCAS